MSALTSFARKWRHGTFGLYVLDRLEQAGVLVRPFQLVDEGLTPAAWPPLPASMKVVALDPDAVRTLVDRGATAAATDELDVRFERSCTCHGLVENGEVVGWMWADPERCRSWTDFALARGEVYLFDARVFPAHRGRGLAPAFRAEVYRQLGAAGVRRFVSVTDAFNAPARRFKAKLGAKPRKLLLLVRLFGRVDRVITLKRYSRGHGSSRPDRPAL